MLPLDALMSGLSFELFLLSPWKDCLCVSPTFLWVNPERLCFSDKDFIGLTLCLIESLLGGVFDFSSLAVEEVGLSLVDYFWKIKEVLAAITT